MSILKLCRFPLKCKGGTPTIVPRLGPVLHDVPRSPGILSRLPKSLRDCVAFRMRSHLAPHYKPRTNTRRGIDSSSQILMQSQTIGSPISSPSRRNRPDADSDVNMDDDFKTDVLDEAVPSSDDVFNDDGNTITIEDQVEEVFDLEPFDWKAEVGISSRQDYRADFCSSCSEYC